ncbi:unnamed protein product, partial [Protopolystoma xenopodis]
MREHDTRQRIASEPSSNVSLEIASVCIFHYLNSRPSSFTHFYDNPSHCPNSTVRDIDHSSPRSAFVVSPETHTAESGYPSHGRPSAPAYMRKSSRLPIKKKHYATDPHACSASKLPQTASLTSDFHATEAYLKPSPSI